MKRYALVLGIAGGLVTACTGDDTNVAVPLDGSVDATSLSDASLDSGNDGAPDLCADAGAPPASLECTGLYSNFATKEVAPSAVAYTPANFLWSDGAQKQRWIELPAGTQIDATDPNEWTFPVGTKVFKEFRVSGKRVETRMFFKQKTNFWLYATYAWNDDDSAATINYGGPVPVGDSGATWTIPTNDDCNECHRGREDRILGFEQVSLGLPGAQGLTLAQLVAQGLISPAPASVSLTIGDDGTGIDPLALGWLHINCGVTCHNADEGSAAYGAGMRLRLDPSQLDGSTPDRATWDILSTTVNVPTVSAGFNGAPRILPGDPADSILYQLIDERGDDVQMPPIASNLVDTADVAVVRSWITALGASADGGTHPEDGGALDGGHHRDGGFGSDAGPRDAGTHDATTGDDASAEDAGVPPTEDAGEDAQNDAATEDAGTN